MKFQSEKCHGENISRGVRRIGYDKVRGHCARALCGDHGSPAKGNQKKDCLGRWRMN